MATVTKTVKVKDAIKAMIPPEWKDDKAFLNLVQAIHTTAYMELAIHAIRGYMRERKA